MYTKNYIVKCTLQCKDILAYANVVRYNKYINNVYIKLLSNKMYTLKLGG